MPALDDAVAFVGRRSEIETLELALDAALGGRGRLVMISGEPGIGKTRMAAELAVRAARGDAAVLWSRCYEREGAPPYWPWVEALRGFVASRDPALLEAELGAGAAEIAEVVPQVPERIEDVSSPPPTADPNQARFRLFDSISGFFSRVAWTTPLVIVLDDLHAADAESLLLLEFMARELSSARLLLIGTYRDVDVSRRHPLSATLGELTREGLMEHVVLRGLDEQDVREFIETTAGIRAPDGLVRAVHAQTEGNALIEGSTGDVDAAVEHQNRLVEATESVPPPGPGAEHALCAVFLPLIDRTLGVADHLDAAEAAADRAVSIEWRVPYHDALAHIGAALVACARELPHPRAYERLLPHRGTLMHTPPIAIDRVLGLLMQSGGDHEVAAKHFDDALALCEAAGYRGEQAWVAAEYAAALRASADRAHASRIDRSRARRR